MFYNDIYRLKLDFFENGTKVVVSVREIKPKTKTIPCERASHSAVSY